MLVKVQKWGNSLAVRIPRAFAGEINISENSSVNLTLIDGSINLKPTENIYEYRLDDLVEQVNENNLHSEYDSGKPEGKEIW
ncbi:MAG: AbrB/MazE/SpoVT family DNA-binding domain-containing protein [Dethiobacteria bacterium]|jgi:antitoxin MazE|nr:AbrB/MazE/SpoVT family DNA-binding domain-containing protein [Dethiobacteria bacterium]